eukprot:c8615_g1_i4.p1 GENE.c8615_g1_i4~~c8615_g1_i4.p1  ORF type:complete len:354 (-),score=73.94 c8615_g1_i4:35-1096(-)
MHTTQKTNNSDMNQTPKTSTSTKRPKFAKTNDESSPQANISMVCVQMYDVWVHEIGPKLDVCDIVSLSMVNQWARLIARDIKCNHSFASIKSISKYCEAIVAWRHLKWELKLVSWSQDVNDTSLAAKWCNVASLILWQSKVVDFSFVQPNPLTQLTLDGCGSIWLSSTASKSFESLLIASSNLESLSLKGCIDKDDIVQWLMNSLPHLTRLSHLSLFGNKLGGERITRISGVLCHMPNVTSLDLAYNLMGCEGMGGVCDCIGHMANLTTLNLFCNNIGSVDSRHIASALANKHRLTYLDLSNNIMGTEGVRLLLPCLTQMPQLSFLDLQSNQIDDELRFQLKKRLCYVEKVRA